MVSSGGVYLLVASKRARAACSCHAGQEEACQSPFITTANATGVIYRECRSADDEPIDRPNRLLFRRHVLHAASHRAARRRARGRVAVCRRKRRAGEKRCRGRRRFGHALVFMLSLVRLLVCSCCPHSSPPSTLVSFENNERRFNCALVAVSQSGQVLNVQRQALNLRCVASSLDDRLLPAKFAINTFDRRRSQTPTRSRL